MLSSHQWLGKCRLSQSPSSARRAGRAPGRCPNGVLSSKKCQHQADGSGGVEDAVHDIVEICVASLDWPNICLWREVVKSMG